MFAKNEKEMKILVQTIRIYSQDTEIEIAIEKCAMVIMKSQKEQQWKE